MKSVDAAVVGAGPAGIAAAVTAARAGLKTLLIEKAAFIGGIPAKGYMTTLCGLYRSRPGSDRPEMLYDGFAREFARLLTGLDGVDGPFRMGRAWVLPFCPESYAAAARRLLENEADLEVLFKARFCGARVSGSRIEALTYTLGGKKYRVRPVAVVDASGDAIVCRAAGASLLFPDTARQAPAIIFPLYHVRTTEISGFPAVRWHIMIRHGVDDGDLPPGADHVDFLPSPEPGMLLVKLNLGAVVKTDPQISEQALAQKANDIKAHLLGFIRRHINGFKDCTTSAGSSPVLHREGVRGRGAYVLTDGEVLSAAKFADAAARGCWPVEKWDENGNFSADYPPEGQYYEIPGRCLQSAEIENLFMAGKCISANSGAIASARVIGCCMATGEAAVKLAAEGLR
ncbi:MAG: FAD-dependent oxidoreductase [Desulfosalsimonas sp.]|uniref:FAD-dependent oxidoreductase n=1 Tax=Desulfosalsimonas sp. TaxID=3073848 RepID=UPI0039706871